MITPPPGWTQHVGAHLVSLYPPSGGARLRFYERLRPVMRFSQAIEAVLQHDPRFRVGTLRDAQTVVTHEGEYGAWVRVDGVREGVAATRFIGAVFADEFVAALDAFVMVPAQVRAIEHVARALVLDVRLALGQRRRRYLYQPPSGWRALQRGAVATWYPPGFPNDRASLVAFPAEPTRQSAYELLDLEGLVRREQDEGWSVDGAIEEGELRSDGGLVGRRGAYVVRRGAEVRRREGVMFVHRGHAYALRLESLVPARATEHRERFLETARSIVALPEPGRGRIGEGLDHEALAHWSE